MNQRVNISLSQDELETIDDAAEAVGETRSKYLRNAALMRAQKRTRREKAMMVAELLLDAIDND